MTVFLPIMVGSLHWDLRNVGMTATPPKALQLSVENLVNNSWRIRSKEGMETLVQHDKAVPCFNHTEKLSFVRHSSEYEKSDSDRKVNRNL